MESVRRGLAGRCCGGLGSSNLAAGRRKARICAPLPMQLAEAVRLAWPIVAIGWVVTRLGLRVLNAGDAGGDFDLGVGEADDGASICRSPWRAGSARNGDCLRSCICSAASKGSDGNSADSTAFATVFAKDALASNHASVTSSTSSSCLQMSQSA